MENIGDWLYVVILIIAGISSIISSARKKAKQVSTKTQHTGKTQQSQQTQQAPPPREIAKGDIFDDDFWGDNTTQQLPKKKPVPSIQPLPKAKQSYQGLPKQDGYNFNSVNEGQSSITKNYENSTFADNEEEYASITLEDLPSKTEEWRNVFIHNEISNRKY